MDCQCHIAGAEISFKNINRKSRKEVSNCIREFSEQQGCERVELNSFTFTGDGSSKGFNIKICRDVERFYLCFYRIKIKEKM